MINSGTGTEVTSYNYDKGILFRKPKDSVHLKDFMKLVLHAVCAMPSMLRMSEVYN